MIGRRSVMGGIAALTIPRLVWGQAHRTERLQALLDAEVARGIPGISVALASRQGVDWRGTAGVVAPSGRRPLIPEHRFGIGSITKTFVAVLVLQLAASGRLSLDQTPATLLAEAAAGIPNADRATLAELLDHSSGIPSWEDKPAWIRAARGGDADPARRWSATDPLDYVRGDAPLFDPGRDFAYSNTNHTLLGLIVERVSSRSLAQCLRAGITAPLGLDTIRLDGFERYDRSRLAGSAQIADAAYRQAAGGDNPAFPRVAGGSCIDTSGASLSCEWAAGGLVATADDLARYAVALRDGRLLDRASMAELLRFNGHGYGRSIGRLRAGPHELIGHTGGVLGFTAAMFWFDDIDLAVVILRNLGAMHAARPNRFYPRDNLADLLVGLRDAHRDGR